MATGSTKCLMLMLALAAAAARAQTPPPSVSAAKAEPGSTAFCLFEVPGDDASRRRWVNLGIVQYVEVGNGEVKVAFGGGNLGSGHEIRVPTASRDEGLAFVDRMRRAAGECRGAPAN
jgi:hypothetical protein